MAEKMRAMVLSECAPIENSPLKLTQIDRHQIQKPDEILLKYYTLLSDFSLAELKTIENKLNDPKFNPMVLKKQLGRDIVAQYHDAEQAQKAQEEFERVFSKNKLPDDIEECSSFRAMGKLTDEELFDLAIPISDREAKDTGGYR